jgi:hypothetical protein
MAQSGVKESITDINLSHIQQPGLTKIAIPGDGSCFFHAILRAFYLEYILSTSGHIRHSYARHFRNALASVLEEYNPITNVRYYEELSRGSLDALVREGVQSCSITAMQNELRSGTAVDNLYHELISDHLNRDIYIYNATLADVDVGFSELGLLYKGRSSIVLLYDSGTSHYELLGIRVPGSDIIETLFTPSHPLIQQLYRRMLILSKKGDTNHSGVDVCYSDELHGDRAYASQCIVTDWGE